ncbi:MAG TPA: Uma2 family endonuclease [Kofleriaceae bacterium]|nr:Uma2 family endonuclease [Kofleriaceae bacterium]
MQAVWLAVPEHFLEERHAHGQDKADELWDGVLHMPPTPSSAHCRVDLDLIIALTPIAKRRGWSVFGDSFGLYDHDKNYRVPDACVVGPGQISKRGGEGAHLVIEMLSPHDEARDKFPFYAKLGVSEIWLIEPYSREHEIHVLRDDRYVRAEMIDGVTRSPLLDVALELADGPLLRLHDGDAVVDI